MRMAAKEYFSYYQVSGAKHVGFCRPPQWLWLKIPEFQNGTLVSGNMDQNPRNLSSLILSYSQMRHLGPPRCAGVGALTKLALVGAGDPAPGVADFLKPPDSIRSETSGEEGTGGLSSGHGKRTPPPEQKKVLKNAFYWHPHFRNIDLVQRTKGAMFDWVRLTSIIPTIRFCSCRLILKSLGGTTNHQRFPHPCVKLARGAATTSALHVVDKNT